MRSSVDGVYQEISILWNAQTREILRIVNGSFMLNKIHNWSFVCLLLSRPREKSFIYIKLEFWMLASFCSSLLVADFGFLSNFSRIIMNSYASRWWFRFCLFIIQLNDMYCGIFSLSLGISFFWRKIPWKNADIERTNEGRTSIERVNLRLSQTTNVELVAHKFNLTKWNRFKMTRHIKHQSTM